MKKINRFAEFFRNLRHLGKDKRIAASCTDIDAFISAMIDEPAGDFEAEYESFAGEYFYDR
ncbi:MAG: hypothetical protein K6B74_01575 [Ruminococcus sp.]|nr:hypothetical protein [Ruminococcus sp.]